MVADIISVTKMQTFIKDLENSWEVIAGSAFVAFFISYNIISY
jgi:hypothetical protein